MLKTHGFQKKKNVFFSQILVQLLRGQRARRPADHLQHGQPEQNQVFVNMANMVNIVIIFNMVNLSKTMFGRLCQQYVLVTIKVHQ